MGDFGYETMPTTINFITNAITKNKPLMIMALAGDREMVVYPDSGAEFTMIDIKEARKHNLPIRKTKRAFSSASGDSINTVGETTIPFRIDGQNYPTDASVMKRGTELLRGLRRNNRRSPS